MLPIFQSDSLEMTLMQTKWAAELNPILRQPMTSGVQLKNVSLITGSNAVNHKLQRKLQGWILTRIRSAAQVYDTQDENQSPQLTLDLTTDADVVVDIFVF